jgi:hypothetical protein
MRKMRNVVMSSAASEAETNDQPGLRGGSGEAAAAVRRARFVVRRLDPWSVLKFSLLFYLCLMIVVLFAAAIVYWLLGTAGVISSIQNFLSNLKLGGKNGFQIDGGWLFTRLLGVGILSVVVWSLVNTLLALLYNLISDVVGGIKVTLSEPK